MPTFEVQVPVGANQIWMRQQIREAVAEATRRGKLRPNSVDSITGENSGNNLGPGTPIIHFDQWERRRDRSQADPQGRRLREHQRAVRAAGRARSSRPRRPLARGRPQVRPARGLEGAGQGLQSRRRRRLRRRRSHVRLPARQGAAVPDARRCESGSAAGAARSVDHGRGEPAGRRTDGLQRQDVADRLQDRRAEPAAGQLLRLGRLRLLGVPPPRRPARRRQRARSTSWLYRDARQVAADAARRKWSPPASRAPAARSRSQAPITEEQIRALKVGDVVLISGRMFTGRDAVHAPPDEARAAGRPSTAPSSITAARSW